MLLGEGRLHWVFCWWLILFFVGGINCFAASEKEQTARSLSHYMKGLIYDWQDNTQKAIAEYQESQVHDADSFASHLRLGVDYARTNKVEEAVAEFVAAAKLNPQDLQSHYFRFACRNA